MVDTLCDRSRKDLLVDALESLKTVKLEGEEDLRFQIDLILLSNNIRISIHETPNESIASIIYLRYFEKITKEEEIEMSNIELKYLRSFLRSDLDNIEPIDRSL